MTVTSSPKIGWAFAPTDSMRSMTARISSSVAVAFMTIIIVDPLCVLATRVGVLTTAPGQPPDQAAEVLWPERLAKSPGVGEGIRKRAGEEEGAGARHGHMHHKVWHVMQAPARNLPLRDAE